LAQKPLISSWFEKIDIYTLQMPQPRVYAGAPGRLFGAYFVATKTSQTLLE
jgi:hypothetical protein